MAILKKMKDGTNTVINLKYPINNTSSIEIRKLKEDFRIKENILKLNRKEVVVKTIVKIVVKIELAKIQ